MAFDAFISYANRDKAAADAACAVLERAGVRCWIAPRDVRPGEEYGDAIIEAIGQCRVMVLIFSSSANDSRQVHREIERAVSKGVAIIPVRIEEVTPTISSFRGSIPHPTHALCTLRVRRHRRLTQHSLPGGPLRPCLGRTFTGLIAPALPGAFLHSITSSARASREGGISIPCALAVLRLITSR
jgi:hypothetical protein